MNTERDYMEEGGEDNKKWTAPLVILMILNVLSGFSFIFLIAGGIVLYTGRINKEKV